MVSSWFTWLGALTGYGITDHEAKALVVVREVGYIDNATYRTINSVDVLTASNALRRLRDVGLLDAHGKSTATYYTPTQALLSPKAISPQDNRRQSWRLGSNQPIEISQELFSLLKRIGPRTSADLIEIAILRLCALRPM